MATTRAAFGLVHIIPPRAEHTHTAIMLHGRGSDGPEFAQELSETTLTGQKDLMQRLPGWRWVFLSSQHLWSTAFEEELPAWFEAHSLTDATSRQDLQVEGIRESTSYIKSVMDEELELLKGCSNKLVLAGISQGGAIAIWTLLCQTRLDRRLGALVGTNTWLPFAKNIEKGLGIRASASQDDRSDLNAFVESMTSAWITKPSPSLLATPIFLGHGTDDAMVDVQLGREARDVLSKVGFQVEWKEYSGAELEGHWIKVPEAVDDITTFLTRLTGTDGCEQTLVALSRAESGSVLGPSSTADSPSFTIMESAEGPAQDTGQDQLQQSVATSWAGFLAAQYCTREVDALRKSLNEHIKQTSIQHELLSVAVVQSRSNPDPPASLAPEPSLETHLESLRQEMMENISQLSQRLTSHEERAENLRSLTSDDIKTVQEKYMSALGMAEYLQRELRDMRSEKIDTENKLTALERQIAAVPQLPAPLPDETIGFLNQLVSRRDELIRFLGVPCHELATQMKQNQVAGATPNPEHDIMPTSPPGANNTSATSIAAPSTKGVQVKVPAKRKQPKTVSNQNQFNMTITRKQPKRKAAEPPQTQPNHKRATPVANQLAISTAEAKPKTKPETVPTDAQDTKDLYRRFRNRYDTNPPRDQVRGIWRFINQIKNPDIAKHFQESLAVSVPEYVKMGSKGRLTTQSNGPQRIFVTISGKMSWKMFSEVFDNYAALYLKE
ncbi:Alpha/Beta hydrolase protein [Triangularia setosa]|uniref:Alpha/Beta hydrolase protein n=1 Tax=Triangularia setosa TaxID=2587417 RepID=A0AAN7A157_9PEZI|nr:Alpha/Beta hydrolase protein [Podospora setosa]